MLMTIFRRFLAALAFTLLGLPVGFGLQTVHAQDSTSAQVTIDTSQIQ